MPKKIEINPLDSEISKIQVWHDDCIRGFKFYDKPKPKVVLETGYFTARMTEVVLEEGERLVQVRSNHYNDSDSKCYHCNPVLVFGKLV